ncbi:MAG: hypothetical protein ACKVOI_13595 [Dongiaceae bacterium]
MSASALFKIALPFGFCLALTSALYPAAIALAGEADVIGAEVRARGNGAFDFDVTVRSNDTGWDAYADLIEVLGPDGKVLGTRVLLHPHETEQPFTRDVHCVVIPAGVTVVTVRARHSANGYGGETLEVVLPQ